MQLIGPALFRVNFVQFKKNDCSKCLEFSETYKNIDWGKKLIKFAKNNIGIKSLRVFPRQ